MVPLQLPRFQRSDEGTPRAANESMPQQGRACMRHESDKQRRLSHELILEKLPPCAEERKGKNDEWWASNDRQRAIDIFEERDFMNEMHIHTFSSRLERDIIVLDVRERYQAIVHYKPGFKTQEVISMTAARAIRTDSSQQPLWVHLDVGHFSALKVI
uniref:Uncharacterized protein n=1 Tax=Coccolithus braarudii TaxID=221442 RepID=A0A7S0PYC9_9EUKA|mmetsp:Transcript_22045/g.47494  ORF Transcript_22045/g.47494 Transcript_22045/m.47494 type:complete len:158 (+) Transcript_22045:483-956(+)